MSTIFGYDFEGKHQLLLRKWKEIKVRREMW